MSTNKDELKARALEALGKRERCGSKKSCSCNDYPKRMHAFREIATPKAVVELLYENADQATKLEIALDALELSVGMNTMNEQARCNAIETLRGK
jgi:hypothetical protein